MSSTAYIIDQVEALTIQYDTRDPEELCRALDIRIFRKDLEKKLKGFFCCFFGQKSITVDSNLNEVLTRIVLAHELGHAVLHAEQAAVCPFHDAQVLPRNRAKPAEHEANLFAAELLLEDDTVLEQLNRGSFFEAAHALYVPPELLDYKFAILRRKGCQIQSPVPRTSDFLKDDLGAYDRAEFGQ